MHAPAKTRIATSHRIGRRWRTALRTVGLAGLLAVAPGHADARWEVGETFREPLRSGGFGPELVVVPAGSFRMGCLNEDVVGYPCRDSEFPVHVVNIDEPFAGIETRR